MPGILSPRHRKSDGDEGAMELEFRSFSPCLFGTESSKCNSKAVGVLGVQGLEILRLL